MIQGIRLQQFRSYTDSSYEFEDGVNIIVGPNASGKTNLLEAILVASCGSSYRAADQELIRHDAEWARVDAFSCSMDRSVKLTTKPRLEKRFVLSGSEQRQLKFTQTIPLVLFEPNDLNLLTQSPELRRGYIDQVIMQIDERYTELLRAYRRALAQRNRLLKQPHITSDMYFVWNVRLSELGAQIAEKRHAFISQNKHQVEREYNKLVDRRHVISLAYQSVLPLTGYGERMLHELERRLESDQQRGFTTLGPHRDDVEIHIDGAGLPRAASRGEARTVVLALKLVELAVVEAARGKKPMMLLDDVFSELDGSRRKNLTTHLNGHQSFITTTDADVIGHNFAHTSNILAV